MCDIHAPPLLLLNSIVLFLPFLNFIFRLGRWHISKETLSHMRTLKYLISLLQLVMNWPRLLSVSEVFENNVWCNQALIIYASGCAWKVILSIWCSYCCEDLGFTVLEKSSLQDWVFSSVFLCSVWTPNRAQHEDFLWIYILSSEFCVSNQHAFCFIRLE